MTKQAKPFLARLKTRAYPNKLYRATPAPFGYYVRPNRNPRGRVTFVAYEDFWKAYDRVRHTHVGRAGFMSDAACGTHASGITIMPLSRAKEVTCQRCLKFASTRNATRPTAPIASAAGASSA
jgi:hypothetical protein